MTVCNLNPLHRGRFCRAQLPKPPALQQVLCASLDSLMQVCGIYELLNQLVTQGERICNAGTSGGRRRHPDRGKKQNTTSSTVARPSKQKPSKNEDKKRRPYRNKKKPLRNQENDGKSKRLDSINGEEQGYSMTGTESAAPSDKEEKSDDFDDNLGDLKMEEEKRTNLVSKLNLDDNFWGEIEAVLNEKPSELERLIQHGLETDAKEEFQNNSELEDEGDSAQTENKNKRKSPIVNKSQQNQKRSPRQINYRTIFRVLHSLVTGRFSSFRQILEMFGITGVKWPNSN